MTELIHDGIANNFALIVNEYKNELIEVEKEIKVSICDSEKLSKRIYDHIIDSGGKRIRPLIHIICSKLCKYTGSNHIVISAILELIHTATLLHDDVVDYAEMRRKSIAARSIWGNQASILAGDYLFASAINRVIGLENHSVNSIITETCKKLAEGELIQLRYNGNTEMSEEHYFEIIRLKTAELISTASRLAGVISGIAEREVEAIAKFGLEIGIAFQLADDVLDYCSNKETLGKTMGKDFLEGKVTLPLLHLMKHCTPEHKKRVEDIIYNGDFDTYNLLFIQNLMKDYGSIFYSKEMVRRYADSAKKELYIFEDSKERDALFILCDFITARDH